MGNNSQFIIEKDVLVGYTGPGGTVSIPEGITAIAASALRGNQDLKTVYLSSSVVRMEACAFEGCSALTTVRLKEGITGILSGTFRNCTALEAVYLHEGIRHIAEDAFSGCEKVRLVTPKDSYGVSYGIRRGIQVDYTKGYTSLTVKDGVLIRCSTYFLSEKKFTVPDGVTAIGDRAFMGSTIQELTLPDSVERLEGSPFHGLYQLKKINMPDRLLAGMDFVQVRTLFNAEFMNIPSTEYQLISQFLEGDFDHSEELCRVCRERITGPIDRVRWMNFSIRDNKGGWLRQVLDLNPDIPERDLDTVMNTALEAGKAEMVAILMARKREGRSVDPFLLEEL